MNLEQYKFLYPSPIDASRAFYISQEELGDLIFSSIMFKDNGGQTQIVNIQSYLENNKLNLFVLDYNIGAKGDIFSFIPNTDKQIVLFCKFPVNKTVIGILKPTSATTKKLLTFNNTNEYQTQDDSEPQIVWSDLDPTVIEYEKKTATYIKNYYVPNQLTYNGINSVEHIEDRYKEVLQEMLEFCGKDKNFFNSVTTSGRTIESRYLSPVKFQDFFFQPRPCVELQLKTSGQVNLLESNDIPFDEAIAKLLSDSSNLGSTDNRKFLGRYLTAAPLAVINYKQFIEVVNKLRESVLLLSNINNAQGYNLPIQFDKLADNIFKFSIYLQNIFSKNGAIFNDVLGEAAIVFEKDESKVIKLIFASVRKDNSSNFKKLYSLVIPFTKSDLFFDQDLMYCFYNSSNYIEFLNKHSSEDITSFEQNSFIQFIKDNYNKFVVETDPVKPLLENFTNTSALTQQSTAADLSADNYACVEDQIQNIKESFISFNNAKDAILTNKEVYRNSDLKAFLDRWNTNNEYNQKTISERLIESVKNSPQYIKYQQVLDNKQSINFSNKQDLTAQEKVDTLKDGIQQTVTTIETAWELLSLFKVNEILAEIYNCSIKGLTEDAIKALLEKYQEAKKVILDLLKDVLCNPAVTDVLKVTTSISVPVLKIEDPMQEFINQMRNALLNFLLDALVQLVKLGLEKFGNCPADLINAGSAPVPPVSLNDLSAPDLAAYNTLLQEQGFSEDQINVFAELAKDITCVLTTQEICQLLNGTSVTVEVQNILKSIIQNKSIYESFRVYLNDINSLLQVLAEVYRRFGLQPLCNLDEAGFPISRSYCDAQTIFNSRQQILSGKMSEEELNQALAAIEQKERDKVEEILKALNGDQPVAAVNLLCNNNSSKNLLADLINNDPTYNRLFQSVINCYINPLYSIYQEDALTWAGTQVINQILYRLEDGNIYNPIGAAIKLEGSRPKLENSTKINRKYICQTFTDSLNYANGIIYNNDGILKLSELNIDPTKEFEVLYDIAIQPDLYEKYRAKIQAVASAREELVSYIINSNNATDFTRLLNSLSFQKQMETLNFATTITNINVILSVISDTQSYGNIETKLNILKTSMEELKKFLSEVQAGFGGTVNTLAPYKLNTSIRYSYESDKLFKIIETNIDNYSSQSIIQSKEEIITNNNIVITPLDTAKYTIEQSYSQIIANSNGFRSGLTNSEIATVIKNINETFLKTISENKTVAYNEVQNWRDYNSTNYYLNRTQQIDYSLFAVNNREFLKNMYVQSKNFSENMNKLFDRYKNFFLNQITTDEKTKKTYIVKHFGFIYDLPIEFYTRQLQIILNRYLFSTNETQQRMAGSFERAYPVLKSKDFIDDITKYAFGLNKFWTAGYDFLREKEVEEKILNPLVNFINKAKQYYNFGTDISDQQLYDDYLYINSYEYEKFTPTQVPQYVIKNNDCGKLRASLNDIRSKAVNNKLITPNTDKVLFEKLQFTESVTAIDKVCNSRKNILELDAIKKQIDQEKQNNQCFELSADVAPDQLQLESKLILKSISNLILKDFIYDILLRGVVSLHNVHARELIGESFTQFLVNCLESEMNRTYYGYYDKFKEVYYDIYNVSDKNDLTFLKDNIKRYVTIFTRIYFNILQKANYISYSTDSLLANEKYFNYVKIFFLPTEGYGNISNKSPEEQNLIKSYTSLLLGDNVQLENNWTTYSLNQSFIDQCLTNFNNNLASNDLSNSKNLIDTFYKIEFIRAEKFVRLQTFTDLLYEFAKSVSDYGNIYETIVESTFIKPENLNLTNLESKNINFINSLKKQQTVVQVDLGLKKVQFDFKNKKYKELISISPNGIQSVNETALSDNQLYDLSVACFPLQDYHVECFKAAYLSNNTRKDSTRAFAATHTALLKCFKNLIYNEKSTVEPLYPETNKPAGEFEKFIKESAKKAFIQIPKIAIQTLDPNIAIAKAALDVALVATSNGKFSDDKAEDFATKVGIQSLATAGAGIIGILPTNLTAAYYLLLTAEFATEQEETTSVPTTCPEVP